MPTKENRAGQQQNYVPKGHGDASGEYGDNATGSNVHFKSFKKPEESETQVAREKEKTLRADEQAKELAKEKVDEMTDQQKIDAQREFEKSMVLAGKDLLGKKATDKMLLEIENREGNFTDAKMLEKFETMKNYHLQREEHRQKRDILKNREWTYYVEKGKLYMTQEPESLGVNAQTFASKEDARDYMAQKAEQKKEKELSKIAEYKNTPSEASFIKKTGYSGNLALEGINETNKKEILDTTEKIFNDFPEVKQKLKSIGNKKGLSFYSANKLAKFKETSQYKQGLLEFVDKYTSPNSLQENGQIFYSKDAAIRNYNERLLHKFGMPANTYSKRGTLGYCKPLEDGESYIILNNINKQTIENSGRRNSKGERGNVAITFKGVAAHELGHSIANTIFEQGGFGSYYSYSRDIHDELQNICKGHNVRKEMSVYALTSDAELIAEAFCSHYENETNPLAEDIYNYVKTRYNKKWGK